LYHPRLLLAHQAINNDFIFQMEILHSIMNRKLKFLDLFSGAGGLSEGFIRAGFEPTAHVETNLAACFTLKTRMSYHWLKKNNREELYFSYLTGEISRTEFYKKIPEEILNTIINAEISEKSLRDIFRHVDSFLDGQKIDLIIGGPPCQAYSVVGRSRDQNRMKGDKRNHLYLYYAEFLKKYRPLYFVFENVTGLLSAKAEDGTLYLNKMRDLFLQYGYKTEYMTLCAQNYGVLQGRKRIIIVGKRNRSHDFYPEPDQWIPNVQVNEIFCDLPKISAGQGTSGPCNIGMYGGTWQIKAGVRNESLPVTWHQSRPNTQQDLEIYRIAVDAWNENKTRLEYNALPERLKTHKHRDSFLDRFKVVASDLPFAHTVVAHIAKDGHYYIHPDKIQNRSITPREAARLQTFPDDYYFESAGGIPSRTSAFCQIGNAVPVLLAQKIAEKLKETWS
jgi:DNA (cytosine-5)-methyltransferase 1